MQKLIPVYIALFTNTIILVFFTLKKQKPWIEMSRKEKKKMKVFIATGTVFFILGLILFFKTAHYF